MGSVNFPFNRNCGGLGLEQLESIGTLTCVEIVMLEKLDCILS